MLSFSPIGAEMAEVHVYLSLFHSVFGGEGATAANAVTMRPLWPKHLDHAPCLQSRPYPYPSPTQTNPHPTGTMRECANEV